MNVHKNARLTPRGREQIVRAFLGGQTPTAIAQAVGVCPRTVRKWISRYQTGGIASLSDRSSRPLRLRRPTASELVCKVEQLRRQRFTGARIAKETGLSPATVSRILRRLRLSRMKDLVPPEPVRRYERERPGELIHLDTKKLGKIDGIGHRITGDRRGQSNRRSSARGGVGWEFVHVCIDDASRIAFTQVMADEKKGSAVRFLKAAVAYYASLGVKVERVMTDNGSCYKSFAFRRACARLGLKQIFTKPYTPKTNGKAERFIQTCLREWAYAKPYQHSDQRTAQMTHWLHAYNWHRPHGGIGYNPPISRLRLPEDNLLMLHI